MRKAISNDEQTWYIQNRREFYTRQGVYRGYIDGAGDYVVKHWQTTIAIFRADGTVWYNDRTYSVTTSAFQYRIRRAMTREELESAARGIIVEYRDYASRAPLAYGHGNRSFRQRLAFWESIYYTPARLAA